MECFQLALIGTSAINLFIKQEYGYLKYLA